MRFREIPLVLVSSCAAHAAAPHATEIVVARGDAPAPVAVGAPTNRCGAAFVEIPAGTFRMGAGPGDGETDEEPIHDVTLPSFCIHRTEITSVEYEACVDAGACKNAGTGDNCTFRDPHKRDHPINCVRWIDADAYCRWAGGRLPTEQEWEYAARGPDARAYPWGDRPPAGQACWNRVVAHDQGHDELGTCAAGSLAGGASPFGVLDMAGNVWEWTSSAYCPYTNEDCGSDRRVDRGGAWNTDDAKRLRTSFRASGGLETAASHLGFRCVQPLP